jgi:hypothetical protein
MIKIVNRKTKRIIILIISYILIFIVVVILFISPITKYLLEKYDIKLTGRHIKTGWLYLNPFTGYVHIGNLKIYESTDLPSLSEGDSIFFSAKSVSASVAMRKLLWKTIEISRITLNQPMGVIIQNKRDFNFNDLIKRYTPKKSDTTRSSLHFNIRRIKITNGQFYYHEKGIPVNYFIKNVYFESSGKRWDADTIASKFSFLSGTGSGSASGNFTLNFKNLDYRIAVVVDKFDLKPIEQYLKDLSNYGYFGAILDADITATGNLKDQEVLDAKGLIAINEFHFGKNAEDDYASFNKLVLRIDELSPNNHLYNFDSIILIHPFLKYERYDYLDNLQRMFGKKGANIHAAKANPGQFNLILEIADYTKVLAKNFFKSAYKINKLAIYNGDLKFKDFALSEEFSVEANPLTIIADSVNRNGNWVKVYFNSGIQPYSNMALNLSINPKDSGDFDLQYHFNNLPATLFNPYLISYTSYPLDKGTIELNGSWKVRNGIIKSENHLLVIDPRVADRLRNKDTKRIPTPLIMFFVEERGNVIDFEIPISGDLKNPKFHLHDAIFDILGNIFVKPATTTYRTEVKNAENEIEKYLTLKWEMRQTSLSADQEEFVNSMIDFLIHNPQAYIKIHPIQYANKEKEYIQFFEAKKKFFLRSKNKNDQVLCKDDSLMVDNMSVKDSLFVHFLNKQVDDSMLFTIQEKCNKYVGRDIINAKFNELNKARENAFMLEFKKKGLENRVIIYKAENNIPYNGFSFYKIEYKGELPKVLVKAYQKMYEFDNKVPRKRFKEEREENNSHMK